MMVFAEIQADQWEKYGKNWEKIGRKSEKKGKEIYVNFEQVVPGPSQALRKFSHTCTRTHCTAITIKVRT